MKTRMHPSIILEKLISSFVFILLIAYYIISQMLGDLSEESIETTVETLFSIGLGIYAIGIIVIIVLLAIFAIAFWIIWKNTYLSFNNDSLIIERGKLFKKITTIHLADIATINIKRNILEKILGTSNLKIDLNTNSETYTGKLVFKQSKALEIKNEILTRMGKEITTENEEINSVINYKPIDIFKHLLLKINPISIITLIITFIIFIVTMDLTEKPSNILLFFLITFIFIVPIIWSIFKTYLSYYNFKCTRDKDDIKLSYGALTTYKYNIPIKKINAVIIHQTFQARILGYYLFEVVNAGIGDSEEEKTIISLYVNEQEKEQIINNILPEYKNKIVPENGDKNILKHYLTAKIFWIILSILATPFTYAISLVLIPITLLIAFGQYKTRKIGNDNKTIIISNGIINKQTIMVKYSNIELIKSKKTIFSKLYNTRCLQINVVGPARNSIFTSGLFSQDNIKNIIKQY